MINKWLSGPYKGIEIDPKIFPELFSEGYHRGFTVTDGLPDGATFSGIQQEKNRIILIFRHDSWKTSKFGEELPMLNPQFSSTETPKFIAKSQCPKGHTKMYVVSDKVHYCPECEIYYEDLE